MFCQNCGNQIDDNADVCIKCGCLINKSTKITEEKPINAMAIVGFVFSFILDIVGLICSIIARNQCKKTGEKGMELATAGMIISLVFLSFKVFAILLAIIISTFFLII